MRGIYKIKRFRGVTDILWGNFAILVGKQKFKGAIPEMFCIELKFVNDCLQKFFEANINVLHLKTPYFEKQTYEKENPINWSSNCKICGFPLGMLIYHAEAPVKEITFNFLLQKEKKIIRNILDKEDLEETITIKFLQNYYDACKILINIAIAIVKK